VGRPSKQKKEGKNWAKIEEGKRDDYGLGGFLMHKKGSVYKQTTIRGSQNALNRRMFWNPLHQRAAQIKRILGRGVPIIPALKMVKRERGAGL